MKEQDIKKIIKQSMLSPSDNFTDELMNKINLQVENKTKIDWKIILLCSACILIFLLSFTISLPEMNLIKFSVRFSPIVLPVVCIIFIFYELNQILEILSYRNKKLV